VEATENISFLLKNSIFTFIFTQEIQTHDKNSGELATFECEIAIAKLLFKCDSSYSGPGSDIGK